MSTYAIGDLQGCYTQFNQLLDKLAFGGDDTLWLLGDLINRGPDSLQTLRMVHAMSGQVKVVLGNHDLHFLAICFGGHSPSRNDTFDELLAAPDCDDLADWLCQQSLMHLDRKLGFAMAHAGIPHLWEPAEACVLAEEVEAALRGKHAEVGREQFCTELYGNKPSLWHSSLGGMPRLKLITNYFTRMRLINESGELNFSHKGPVEQAPPGWRPWYEYYPLSDSTPDLTLLFGHWAALDGVTGRADIIALDTGCVWGRKLTALCLESRQIMSVDAAADQI